MDLQIRRGDEVFYWSRRPGEPARQIHGTVIGVWGNIARVEGHDTCVSVHTIDTSRLKKKPTDDKNDNTRQGL